jgi:hypothetical protein
MKKTKSINIENIKTKNMKTKIYIALGVIFLMLLANPLICSAQDNWALSFTLRATEYYGGTLEVKVDDNTVESISIKPSNNGPKTIPLTGVMPGVSRISLRHSPAAANGVLLYNVSISHNGKPVRFSPWTYNESHPDMRGWAHTDSRLILIRPRPLEGTHWNEFTSQPLQDAPELEIKQSDLAFSKDGEDIRIYDIQDGDNIIIKATVRNLGAISEDEARVEFYVDDVLQGTSPTFSLAPDASTTQSFNLLVNFGSTHTLKIESRVVSSNSTFEGKECNNRAIKWIVKRPYFFFTDITQTPGYKYQTEEPYASWINVLKSLSVNRRPYLRREGTDWSLGYELEPG